MLRGSLRRLGKRVVVLGVVWAAAGWAWAEPTAKEALSVLAQQRGQPFADQVLQIVGVGGADQPQVWRILTRDPYRAGAVRDFSVQGGRVVSDQYVPDEFHARLPQVVLKAGDIEKDSRQAFLVADKAANRAKVGFDSLDYELSSSDPKVGGVWVVRLNDQRGTRVGEIAVGARGGEILREQWARDGGPAAPTGAVAPTSYNPAGATAGAASPGVGTDGSSSTAERMGQSMAQGWDATKDGIQKGSTAVKTGFVRAGESVREFWKNLRRGMGGSGSGASPSYPTTYYPPGTAPVAPAPQPSAAGTSSGVPSVPGGVTVDPENARYVTPAPAPPGTSY